MAVFDPTTHKAVVGTTDNPADDVPVDTRVMLARLLMDMGLFQVIAQNTPPSDQDSLWWHIDVKALKRFDAVQGNWFAATPNQIAMHVARRAVLGSVTEVSLEEGDQFTFWDVSQGDLKVINREDLMAALGPVRTVATQEGVQGGGALSANRTLRLDLNGLTAKELPASDDVLGLYSVADAEHRGSTVNQVAAGVASSDYLHSEMFFMGMM